MKRFRIAFVLVLFVACAENNRSKVGVDGIDRDNPGGDDGSGSNDGDTDSPTVDLTPPVVSLSPVATKYRGGTTFNLQVTATDDRGVASLSWTLTLDGTTYSDPTPFTGSTITVAVPNVDVGTARVSVRALDDAGNVGEAFTTFFAIDSTAPDAGVFALDSNALTNDTAAFAHAVSCNDNDAIFVSLNNTRPDVDAAGWQACATTASALAATLASADGDQTIYLFRKDDVGNVSFAPASLVVTYDHTPPDLDLLSPAEASIFQASADVLVEWTTSDPHGSSLLIEASSTGAAPFVEIATVDGLLQTLSNWHVTAPRSDSGTYAIRLTATDAAGNSSTAIASAIVMDGTRPAVSAVLINDGDLFTPTQFTRVFASVSDALSSQAQLAMVQTTLPTDACPPSAPSTFYPANALTQTQTYLLRSIDDGTKKICVWARDQAGNVSAAASFDTIEYRVGSIPIIQSFGISGAISGTPPGNTTATVSWAIEDDLSVMTPPYGLTAHPVSLQFSTNGTTWQNFPSGNDFANAYPPVALADNTRVYNETVSVVVPTTAPFKLRLRVTDIANNTSIAAETDFVNIANPDWRIYAGSVDTGIGGSGLSATLRSGTCAAGNVAVDPITNDVYSFNSANAAIYRVSARTGRVEVAFGAGGQSWASLVGSSITLPAGVGDFIPMMRFDSAGRLYLKSCYAPSIVYRVDLTQSPSPVTEYVGGTGGVLGMNNGAGFPAGAFVEMGAVAFDSANSMYFLTSCEPNQEFDYTPVGGAGAQAGVGTTSVRLMKVTQNSNGTPGPVSIVAGACGTSGTRYPAAPPPEMDYDPLSLPLTGPLSSAFFPSWGNTAVVGDGDIVYVSIYNAKLTKLVRDPMTGVYTGKATSIVDGAMSIQYDRVANKLYVVDPITGSIRSYTPNAAGDDIEDVDPYLANTGSVNCNDDGADGSNACFNAVWGHSDVAADGSLVFADGYAYLSSNPFRVRYRAGDGSLRTLLGSPPFHSPGIFRTAARAAFTSLHYLSVGVPSASGGLSDHEGFPEGLYFQTPDGPTFGYIAPDGIMHRLWGSAAGRPPTELDAATGQQRLQNGAIIDPSYPMFGPYQGGDGSLMTFDADKNEFWFRNFYRAARLDRDRRHKWVQQSFLQSWEDLPDGSNALNAGMFVSGGMQNFSLWKYAGNVGFLLMGNYDNGNTKPPRLHLLNFGDANNLKTGTTPDDPLLTTGIRHLTGLTGPTGPTGPYGTAAASIDETIDGPDAIFGAPLGGLCRNNGTCFTASVPTLSVYGTTYNDVVLFSEVDRLRMLTNASTPGTRTLTNVFTVGAQAIGNFTVSPLGKRVFFLGLNGDLYCKGLEVAPTVLCDGATSLGPPTPLAKIPYRPNQLTWKDNATLFIAQGEYIYEYTLPMSIRD